MALKHTNPSDPRSDRYGRTYWAHAPYNFVPLPERVVTVTGVPNQDIYSHITGYLECTLETLTPVYTRSVMTPAFFAEAGDKPFHELSEQQKETRAEFYSTDANQCPMIPGSSLKGMIRAMVEIVGFGKMQWVTNEPLIYRAVGDRTSLGEHYRLQMLGANKTSLPNTHLSYPSPQVRGGYLRRQGSKWAIQPARTHLGETFVHVEYAHATKITGPARGRQITHDVYVMPVVRKTFNRGRRGQGDLILDVAVTSAVASRTAGSTSPSGMVAAVLVESGHMGGKEHAKHWHCAVYEPDPGTATIPIPDPLWQVYANDRDETRGIPTRKLEKDGDALFYLLDAAGRLVFFGPTMMFRLPYPNLPRRDLVPTELQLEEQIDLAEAIFGFTKSAAIPEDQRARASRVFFSDAVCDSVCIDPWLANGSITPKILGSPKPTSFQHYLTQQEPDDRKKLDHYASPPPHRTVIRGHKLYWHKKGTGRTEIEEADHSKIVDAPKQYTRIKPVRAGVTFTFRISFENLRDYELGALLWAVTLPGQTGHTYCHKLGMGKPLGMGSVAISTCLYESDRISSNEAKASDSRASRYGRLLAGTAWHEATTHVIGTGVYLQAFQDYVLNRLDPEDKGAAQALHELYRIKMLLAMLEWPGPDPSRTAYLELGAFRERPVLPDPLAVLADESMTSTAPPTDEGRSVKVEPAPQQADPHLPATHVGPAAELPIQPRHHGASQADTTLTPPVLPPPSQPRPAPIREATVVKAEGSFVTVEVDGEQVNIQLDQLANPGYNLKERQWLYPVGSKIKVRDLGVSNRGKRRLTTKGI